MLFSNRYKFLFVHIAKTAGTSIQAALKKLRARDLLSYPQLVCYNISKFCGHRIGAKIPRHARLVAALELMPREQFEALFKFAFIRNPWDIQVSAHHHLKRERPELIRENGCEAFGDFLRWSLGKTTGRITMMTSRPWWKIITGGISTPSAIPSTRRFPQAPCLERSSRSTVDLSGSKPLPGHEEPVSALEVYFSFSLKLIARVE